MKKKYPYIVVRVMPAIYMPLYVDSGLSVEELIEKGKEIVLKKKLRNCVVASDSLSYYLELDGTIEKKAEQPSGGIEVSNSDFEQDIVPEE